MPQKSWPSLNSAPSPSLLVYLVAATIASSLLLQFFCPRTLGLAVPSAHSASLPPENHMAHSFPSELCSDVTISESPSLTSSHRITTLLCEFLVSLRCFFLSMVLSLSLIFSLVYLYIYCFQAGTLFCLLLYPQQLDTCLAHK